MVSAVKVADVYDINRRTAKDFAWNKHINHVSQSLDEMMEWVDAVYIATPHLSHYELTKFALEHQKHILCETPLVLYGKEARELYEFTNEH